MAGEVLGDALPDKARYAPDSGGPEIDYYERFGLHGPEEAMIDEREETGPFPLEGENAETETPSEEGAEKTHRRPISQLTTEERDNIIKETGWSSEVVDYIENSAQYEIYKAAGLHESTVNGRRCLIQDIDFDYLDPSSGMTNREMMLLRKAPFDPVTGKKYELHHMEQLFDGPVAELIGGSQHRDGNYKTLHPIRINSWRNDPIKSAQYRKFREQYWISRAGGNMNGSNGE